LLQPEVSPGTGKMRDIHPVTRSTDVSALAARARPEKYAHAYIHTYPYTHTCVHTHIRAHVHVHNYRKLSAYVQ